MKLGPTQKRLYEFIVSYKGPALTIREYSERPELKGLSPGAIRSSLARMLARGLIVEEYPDIYLITMKK